MCRPVFEDGHNRQHSVIYSRNHSLQWFLYYSKPLLLVEERELKERKKQQKLCKFLRRKICRLFHCSFSSLNCFEKRWVFPKKSDEKTRPLTLRFLFFVDEILVFNLKKKLAKSRLKFFVLFGEKSLIWIGLNNWIPNETFFFRLVFWVCWFLDDGWCVCFHRPDGQRVGLRRENFRSIGFFLFFEKFS